MAIVDTWAAEAHARAGVGDSCHEPCLLRGDWQLQ